MKNMLDVEIARERRLWITKVGFPSVAGAIAIWKFCPEVYYAVGSMFEKGVNYIKTRLKKEEK